MLTFEKLADLQRPGVSSDLTLLGKRAARAFLEGEAENLSLAVQKVAQEERLSMEQVSRVATAANQQTWQHLFREKDNRDTQFDPANGEDVWASMTRPTAGQVSMNDYMRDPQEQVSDDIDFREVFGMKETPEEYPRLNPTFDLEQDRLTTKTASDLAATTQNRLTLELQAEHERFYGLVKQAHLQLDHGIAQMAQAIGHVVESPTFAYELMTGVTKRLEAEGIRINSTTEMRKLAEAVVVDSDHPILQSACAIEQMSQMLVKTASAKESLDKRDSRLTRALYDKLRGL